MDINTAEKRLSELFGASLRRRRKARGLTQEELASLIGSNRRFISELERGKGTSYLGPALAAAEALGIKFSAVFEETPSQPSPNLPPA